MIKSYCTTYGAGWRAAKCPKLVPNHFYCPHTGLALKHLQWAGNPYSWRHNPIKFIAWQNGFFAGQMGLQ